MITYYCQCWWNSINKPSSPAAWTRYHEIKYLCTVTKLNVRMSLNTNNTNQAHNHGDTLYSLGETRFSRLPSNKNFKYVQCGAIIICITYNTRGNYLSLNIRRKRLTLSSETLGIRNSKVSNKGSVVWPRTC